MSASEALRPRSARDLRLVVPALVGWATAAVAVSFPGAEGAVGPAWGLSVGVLSAGVLLRRRTPGRLLATVATAAAVAALVLSSTAIGGDRRAPLALGEGTTVSGVVEITGSVAGASAIGPGFSAPARVRVPGTLVASEVDGRAVPVHSPVLVFLQSDGMDFEPGVALDIGARIAVTGRLTPTDPGSSVAWLLFVDGEPRLLARPSAPLELASGLRDRFVARSAALPGDGGALLPGLAIGDTSALPESLDEAMKESSLGHLTAVSGANCAVVVAAAIGCGALMRFRLRGRVLLAAGALTAFVVLVTPQPSVLRAATMAAVVLAAMATGRPGGGLAALSLAAVILLVLDPWLALDYGFALSALATAGLLMLSGPIAERLGRVMPEWLAAAIAVPAAAQLACQPVLILLQPSLSLASVPANLLAAPAAPLATMLGLVACLALAVAPPLGDALALLAWMPSAWIAAVARFFAAHSAALPWLPGLFGAVVLAVAIGLAVIGVRTRRHAPVVLAIACMVVVLAGLQGRGLGTALSRPDAWRVVSCDVGQGAATLVRGSAGVALIDTGDDPQRLRSCLDAADVTEIDLLVLTHFDRDHIGAASEVAGRVGTLLVGPSDGAEADRLVADLAAGGATVHRTVAGDHGVLGDLSWRAVWPEPDTEAGNGASIALLVALPGMTAAFLGDLGEESQDALLRTTRLPRVDVVGVAHHGSADQSRALYEELAAPLALVSVGAGNDYGHPAPTLLQMLESLGESVVRTDRSGTAFLQPVDGGVSVWTEGASSD